MTTGSGEKVDGRKDWYAFGSSNHVMVEEWDCWVMRFDDRYTYVKSNENGTGTDDNLCNKDWMLMGMMIMQKIGKRMGLQNDESIALDEVWGLLVQSWWQTTLSWHKWW